MNVQNITLRILFSLFALSILSACKSTGLSTVDIVYSSKINYTEDELLSGSAIFGKHITDDELPSEAVISLSPEMEEFLEKHVMTARTSSGRAQNITRALFDENKLGMTYDFTQTLTAQQAFDSAVGNCLAFSYLYAAFAKEAGIKVEYQEVEIPPAWDAAQEDLLITSRHVNIVIPRRGGADMVVDINRVELPYNYKAIPMSEDHVIALYYGNMGSEFLLEEKYDLAFKYISKALRLAPQEAPLWTNLGVLYRRKGLNDHAERAHYIALGYDNNNQSAISNLSYLYHQMGQFDKEAYFDDLSAQYQQRNPYYHYYKAKDAFEEQLYTAALNHIDDALRRYKKDPKFYLLQSEIYKILGDTGRAEDALASARRIKKT